MHEKLNEIASRIHCPDSEGGKYAAGIKAEIEAIANESIEACLIPAVALKIERVLRWSQRVEPSPQTPIYETATGGWSEIEENRKQARKLGIYLGKGWVAMINECGDMR